VETRIASRREELVHYFLYDRDPGPEYGDENCDIALKGTSIEEDYLEIAQTPSE